VLAEDGSGGLDFSELVNVFEPASLASGHAAAKDGAETAVEDLEGFMRFTPEQIESIGSLDAFTPRGSYKPRKNDPLIEAIRRASKVHVTDADVKRVCGALPQKDDSGVLVAPPLADGRLPPVTLLADGRVDLGPEEWDGPVPFDPLLKRCPATRQEEVDLIKRTIAGRVRRRGADFFDAWKRFDELDRGFLNQQQFLGLIGPKGFDFGLSRRAVRVLIQSLSDEGGAIEPLVFDDFLRAAGEDETTGQALHASRLKSIAALQRRVKEWRASQAARDGGKLEHQDEEEHLPRISGRERPDDDREYGINLNASRTIRGSLKDSLHPLMSTALGGSPAMLRANLTETFGKETDPTLLVRDSPRVSSTRSMRAHLADDAEEQVLRSTTTGARRRPPLPRSLGYATTWSDVVGAGPDVSGPSPADRSSFGISSLRRRMMYSRSLPTLSTAAHHPDGETKVQALLEQAEHRTERTWRTSKRPQVQPSLELVKPPPASAAFQGEGDRFVRKGRLAPGQWELAVTASAEPCFNAGALPPPLRMRETTSRIIGGLATTTSHGKPIGETLGSQLQTSLASHALGTTGSLHPGRQRSMARSLRGQEAVVRIQRSVEADLERKAHVAEARAAAIAGQQLRYARAALGLTAE
jgi:hypothetical protein